MLKFLLRLVILVIFGFITFVITMGMLNITPLICVAIVFVIDVVIVLFLAKTPIRGEYWEPIDWSQWGDNK